MENIIDIDRAADAFLRTGNWKWLRFATLLLTYDGNVSIKESLKRWFDAAVGL